MKGKLILFFCILCIWNKGLSQDLLVLKNQEIINVKVLEVSPKIVKYKKTENINGPTYSIVTNLISFIKFNNGTIDYLGNNPSDYSSTKTFINNLNELKNKSDTLAQNVKSKVNDIPIPIQSNNDSNPKIIEKPTLISEKISSDSINSIITEKPINNVKINLGLKNYKKRKTFWLISGLSFGAFGLYNVFEVNRLYNNYKNATTNATSIRESIQGIEKITPYVWGLSGLCLIEYVVNLNKYHKSKSVKITLSNQQTGLHAGLKLDI